MNSSTYFTRDEFAQEIRRLMKEYELTQAGVADAMGIRPQTVGAALAGTTPNTLCRIYEHLTGRKVERDYFKVPI